MTNALKNIPGLAVCLALALPCWFVGQRFPIIGAPVFAILAGMAIAVFWKQPTRGRVQTGIAFSGKKVLQAAVVLLGFGLNLAQIAQVGMMSLPIIGSTIATALITAFLLHKVLRMPSEISTLIGVGSSICGGLAIAATAPVIKAHDKDVAQAISVIFLFNVLAALIFPSLGNALGMSNEGFGLFAGTAVNDTSSVTAAAAAWDGMHPGSNALDQATIVKLTRTLAIIPITLVLGIWVARRESRDPIALEAQGHSVVKPAGKLGGFSLRRALPVFILLFLAASVITTIAVSAGIDAAVFEPLKTLSKFFIVMAMAAIGLNTDIVHLVKSGGKPILMGLCCWVAIAAVSLGMQHVLGLW
ncbi:MULTISPECIES: YeiH family protein [Eggerthella]|uniref:YeiH family protein n=1 Tax=Eggerthella TaxID=84111 RepID=UPI00137125CD|nr:YeiH family protein [Eggerthella lenta]MZJ94843.1 putative sulfate exporter family transporter [Eggerthella sp. BIOML-A3]MZJ99879.1 putative sulfate exporter family transporter [Eggerthella sp. BIOML-A1]MZK35020.1 putative sulfate exporter family transporter [Eggerthella sp. BIOML-A5]MDB1756563.1 YeiH family protein [Eggerthella lenta]MDB1763153.1 YeiH family protein [Eggerthella lenta]